VEVLSRLSWMDLLVIGLLAGGVFVGYTQGLIRYVLNAVVVLIAFVVAAQLRDPLIDVLRFWTAFTPEVRELLVFLVLFIGLVVGGWFLVRAFYKQTRLPIVKQLDEIGGAIFGLIFAALVISLQLVILDTLYDVPAQEEGAGILKGWYDGLNSSLIIGFFRDTLIPAAGVVLRPFVPREIAQYLLP
jgi:uncharacterized membrane protein required for colicin V production